MSADTQLINSLAMTRVLNHELLASQERLIGALCVGLAMAKQMQEQAPTQLPKGIPWAEFENLANKAIAAAVQTP